MKQLLTVLALLLSLGAKSQTRYYYDSLGIQHVYTGEIIMYDSLGNEYHRINVVKHPKRKTPRKKIKTAARN